MNRTTTSNPKTQNTLLANFIWIITVLALFFFMFLQKANAQCTGLVCKSSLNVSLGQNGTTQITPDMVMASPSSACPAIGNIQLMDATGKPFGNTVNCSHVGQTFQAKFFHNYGNTCWTTIKVEDKLGPKITCSDATITCAELPTATFAQPTAADNCTAVTGLTYTETTQNFSCAGGNNVTGFNGPFEMWKWTKTQKYGSTGEVWTMNMPNEVTVVGATNLPVRTNPRYVTSYSAMVTAAGYVKFNWQATGSGNLNTDAFYFTVNDTCVQLTMIGVSSGTFSSWYVKPGDIIRFEQTSDGDANNIVTRIFNFQFIADIQNIIKRTWTATDANGNTGVCTQNINVRKLSGGTVIFPPNYNDIDRPSLECGASSEPADTGWPKWDLDGNPATTNDQIILKQAVANCLKMGYTDQVLTSCPGGKTVIRDWTIVENCSAQIYRKSQIIKIYDKTPPVITCPSNVTMSANSATGCSATITLPQATATDGCSGIESITPNWKYGTGYGPFNAATGTHIVTYTAKDKCGNTASCTMTVTIVDNVPPVVVAKTNLVVSLTTNGMATIAATAINDGSNDNCCLDKFEIRRMDDASGVFGPTVKFQCDDAGKNIQVILKVTDCNGNANTAMVTVEVQDKLAPTFSLCPANTTVNCGTDLTNLNGFGAPTVVDDCSYNLVYVETPQLNGMCGRGSVTRTWTATDAGGKAATCVQTITVANTSPWNGTNNIIWPQDYTVTACTGSNPLDPNSLPVANAKPIFKNLNGCTNPVYNYTDQTFTGGSNVCFKIFRKWTVIDMCQNPGANNEWTYTQSISVVDNQVPVLTVPKDTIVYATGKTCGSFNVKLPKATATDCSPNVTIQNSFNNTGADLEGVFPYGTTIVKYTAFDGCGNATVKETKVTVKDGSKPTPICFHGFTTTIMPLGTGGGEVWINSKVLDAGSNDNCTVSKKLKFSFSSNPADTMRSFNCDSLGQRRLQLWVTDEAGNQDYCSTYIIIQNNMGACTNVSPKNMANIGGSVKTEEIKIVEKVKLAISYNNANNIFSGLDGKFEFLNIPIGNTYKVTPEKDTFPINGVSTYDVFLLNRHILGLQPITSPYKLIAADVDNNTKLSTADLVEMRKLILVISSKFPNNKSWRFIPKSYTFATPTNPWATAFPESTDVNLSAAANQMNNDFIGIKIGDLNGNAITGLKNPVASTHADEAKSISILVNNNKFEKDDLVKIPFTVNSRGEVTACQFTLDFDTKKLSFEGFEQGNVAGVDDNMFNFTQLQQGKIAAAWFNSSENPTPEQPTLCYFIFKANTNGTLNNSLYLSNNITTSEVYDENGRSYALVMDYATDEKFDFEVFQNQPNPFDERTVINFKIPEENQVKLTVFDASGKTLFIKEQTFAKGYQQFSLYKNDFPNIANGVFFYKIDCGKYSAVRKMVLLP